MRVGIVGCRNYFNYDEFFDTLMSSMIDIYAHDLTIVTGDAKGVDALAAQLAKEVRCPIVVCDADWNQGLKAGPIRNEKIVKQIDILVALWDGQSKGTKSSIDLAVKNKIQVLIIPIKV